MALFFVFSRVILHAEALIVQRGKKMLFQYTGKETKLRIAQ